jgi:hypothetical protein
VAWYLTGQRRFESSVKTDDEGDVTIRYDLSEGQAVVVRYPHWASFVEVPAGSGFYLPTSFESVIVLHEVPYAVTMVVSVAQEVSRRHGSPPKLKSVSVSEKPPITVGALADDDEERQYEAPPISSSALREVPVGRLFALAKLAATHTAPNSDEIPDMLLREREIAGAIIAPVRQWLTIRNTDAGYRYVADVFRAAEEAGHSPVAAVVEACNVSPAQANRYIRESRNRGLLEEPPPNRRRMRKGNHR